MYLFVFKEFHYFGTIYITFWLYSGYLHQNWQTFKFSKTLVKYCQSYFQSGDQQSIIIMLIITPQNLYVPSFRVMCVKPTHTPLQVSSFHNKFTTFHSIYDKLVLDLHNIW